MAKRINPQVEQTLWSGLIQLIISVVTALINKIPGKKGK